MRPKKDPNMKRSILIGLKVNESTYEKLKYLAGRDGETINTYIYHQLLKHIEDKEPWITREIEDLKKEEQQ